MKLCKKISVYRLSHSADRTTFKEVKMQALPGVFKLIDTLGFPLEIILLELKDRGLVVAWDEFITDARTHGWTEKTIRTKILGAVNEAHGTDYLEKFTELFEVYVRAHPGELPLHNEVASQANLLRQKLRSLS